MRLSLMSELVVSSGITCNSNFKVNFIEEKTAVNGVIIYNSTLKTNTVSTQSGNDISLIIIYK